MNSTASTSKVDVSGLKSQVLNSEVGKKKIAEMCKGKGMECQEKAGNALFCQLMHRSGRDTDVAYCTGTTSFLQVTSSAIGSAPEDDLAKEMTHDLEMNFNKIAPFGKEDTAKELQDHAAKTQDTLVDAVEN